MEDYRIDQVNNLMQKILAELIEKDFCASRDVLISLTRVECSGNLQEAKVFISVLPDKERENIVSILERDAWQFQEKLNKKLRMRPVPKIIFIGDNLPEQAQEVETILQQLKDSKKH
jgi:ribosome-binding factor A